MSAHSIRLAGGDQSFACESADTLLRAAQRAGIGFPYECNVGSCGNCKFELLEGEVSTAWADAPGLSEKDKQRKRHLGCQTHPLSDCVIKLRPAERYAPPHRPRRLAAVLASRRSVTHDIEEFRFMLADAQRFEPGQYALVWMPGVTGARAYSMSNTAADDGGHHWDFQVRRVPGGHGSERLFTLEPGAPVEIDGPYGMAWLKRDSPRDILCLAGGSGLAPMVSIARGAVAAPELAGRQLHFVYGGRTAVDLCGRDLLQMLPGFGERLHYHPCISTPHTEGQTVDGVPVAFVHEHALQLFGDKLPTMEIYFAGPPAMANAVQRMLLDAKVPPEQQHFDQFY